MIQNIVCGDCLDVMASMSDNSVDLIVTDPPYDLPKEEREKIHRELVRVSKDTVIAFCSPENLWHYPASQYLFWVKPISTKNTSKRYSRFVEMILVFGEGTWNTKYHWSQYTNVFTDLVEGKSSHLHEKPLSLLLRLIRNHSVVGDLILDPFAGTCTTGMAAKMLGRDYLMIELDEQWCQIGQHRIDATETRLL